MENATKFSALPKIEKGLLIIFVGICLILSFSFSNSIGSTFLYSLSLFVQMHTAAGYWIFNGKPLWQVYLTCYGVSTFEIFFVYFGFLVGRWLTRIVPNWWRGLLRKGVRVTLGQKRISILKEKTGYQAVKSFSNKKSQGFIVWLEKQNTITLLVVFLFPVFDILVIPILASKKLTYGYWYLAAANLLRILIVILFAKLGINFTISCFFS